ncbi:MAG: choice-of-anchor tandem repeat GloVer-containing protein [Candidatus Tumulicola sp.]
MGFSRGRYALVLALSFAAGCTGGSTQGPLRALPALPAGATAPGLDRSIARGDVAFTETVLHSFGGPDGAGPITGMVHDPAGGFYGATLFGGSGGGGTAFKLTPSGSGYTEKELYGFKGGLDGKSPWGIISHGAGALYGVTFQGGSEGNGGNGWGTVFELTRGNSGYTENILYRFRGGTDAWEPLGPIVFDKAGTLYGVSAFGGSRNDGAVFKLTPSPSGYTESLVYSFPGGSGGQLPEAGLTIDKNDSIYGTTMYGGGSQGYCGSDGGCGTVFKLTRQGSGYSERVIHAFNGSDGNLPYGAVTVDERTGAVFGTTFWGGTKGIGLVFKLTPRGSSYDESALHSFKGNADGFLPEGTILLKSDGTLYGTASLGGGGCHGIGCGAVYELTHSKSGYAFHVIYDFKHPLNGAEPEQTNLLSDESGALYGTTRSGGAVTSCADGGPGGALGCGTVFKLVP